MQHNNCPYVLHVSKLTPLKLLNYIQFISTLIYKVWYSSQLIQWHDAWRAQTSHHKVSHTSAIMCCNLLYKMKMHLCIFACFVTIINSYSLKYCKTALIKDDLYWEAGMASPEKSHLIQFSLWSMTSLYPPPVE